MDARPFGVIFMLITLSNRMQFIFKVRFQPNLVSLGTQPIATSGNAQVKKFLILIYTRTQWLEYFGTTEFCRRNGKLFKYFRVRKAELIVEEVNHSWSISYGA